MIERCNNTSVGILVFRDGELLLIQRRKPPYGWAPPAGHVEDGEDYQAAAGRELLEEVGLRSTRLRLVLSKTYPNRCRRPGGDWHRWEVYEAGVQGELACNPEEVASARWVGPDELEGFLGRTLAYLDDNVTQDNWMRSPGLEPIWVDMLTKAGLIGEIEGFKKRDDAYRKS